MKEYKVRNTKIIATLGPATDNRSILENMILSGIDLARINMSHGDNIINAIRIRNLQQLTAKIDRKVALFIDLPGPRILIGKFINNKIKLYPGSKLILDPDLDPKAGTEQAVYVSYPNFYQDLSWGDILLLDDGKIVLKVELIKGNKIFCIAQSTGFLSNNKSIYIPNVNLSLERIINKDKENIIFASQFVVDFFSISFIKTAKDLCLMRDFIKNSGSRAKLLAKIETKQSIINLDEIVKEADGIIISRGALGINFGFSKLAILQKKIVQTAKYFKKPCFITTQVMESMIENSMPTSAEVMDVANSVMEGIKGIILAAETAISKDPVRVIKYIDEICVEAENFICS